MRRPNTTPPTAAKTIAHSPFIGTPRIGTVCQLRVVSAKT